MIGAILFDLMIWATMIYFIVRAHIKCRNLKQRVIKLEEKILQDVTDGKRSPIKSTKNARDGVDYL